MGAALFRGKTDLPGGKMPCMGKPISVRGIQKRMESYARKASLKVSCHHLRHTMATQMLNADADLSTIQDLLGHSNVKRKSEYVTYIFL